MSFLDAEDIVSNAEGYKVVFCIENILREYIAAALESYYGSNWLKKGCPPHIRKNYLDAIVFAKGKKIYRWLPLNPLYFSDFPDLRQLIQKSDNWKNIFSDKLDIRFINIFENLEPIRNNIAHSRLISEDELLFLNYFLNTLIGKIGNEECASLLVKSFEKYDIKAEIEIYIFHIVEFQNLVISSDLFASKSIKEIENLNMKSWTDEEIIDLHSDFLSEISKKIRVYQNLPRIPGRYFEVERWARLNNFQEDLEYLRSQLTRIKEMIT